MTYSHFWQLVYLEALKRNRDPDEASDVADVALAEYKKRWVVGDFEDGE
jgi:hypothetical protein